MTVTNINVNVINFVTIKCNTLIVFFRVRNTESASTALTNAQLAEHYSNCIKLSSENVGLV